MQTRAVLLASAFIAGLSLAVAADATEGHLGLPPLPVPADNPITPDKVALGDKLFNDLRFSSTGQVACATCHNPKTGFTDSPNKVSVGIEGKTGTRNAPTVLNAAYSETMFWDGRSPTLEDQALHPFLNPVEMALPDHNPILKIVREDATYKKEFKKVFGVSGEQITMDHVTRAIAAFERTVVSGDSAFDRWFYGGDSAAMSAQQIQGYNLFIGKARCVSCHVIEQTSATFTDNRFHNIGVGVNRIQADIPALAEKYLEAEYNQAAVDVAVLTDPRSSELGRFAVTHTFDGLGAFKTPTLRNVAITAPYMHDGSIASLREVVTHYNNGGVTNQGDAVNDFLSGGIRPLNLTDPEVDAVVAFMEALTSPAYASQAAQPANR